MSRKTELHLARRSVLAAAAGGLAAPMLGGKSSQVQAQVITPGGSTAIPVIGRRKLGALEVSSIGLGVQNMHRTYQTTIPSRPAMHAIIRAAFEHDVTFFDCAESLRPHE